MFNHTVLHTYIMFLVQRQNNECVFACMCVYVCVHEQACLKKLPVSIMSGLDWNQVGKTRPLKVEKPRMRRLRDEFRSTYWRNEEEKKEERDFVLLLCSTGQHLSFGMSVKCYWKNVGIQTDTIFNLIQNSARILLWQVRTGHIADRPIVIWLDCKEATFSQAHYSKRAVVINIWGRLIHW